MFKCIIRECTVKKCWLVSTTDLMSYAYGAYGPYAPYGAYGALSPYDVNALGLVQAYRAMGTKTESAPGDRSAS